MARTVRHAVRRTKLEQREASVEKLLAAARRLFVSKGYASTTLDEIAAQVELTKGSVYFYFRSKEAVLLKVLDQAEQVVVDRVIELIQDETESATNRIIRFLHHQGQLGVSARENMLLIILMSLEFESGPVADKVKSLYRKMYTALEELIAEGQRSKEFRTDSPPRELASVVMANHDGAFLEWHRRSNELSGSALLRALRFLVVSGLTRS